MIPFSLIQQGFLLGWSVAWPPGPINAEMMRRGLSKGFWPAYSVGLGACFGDFCWAIFVSLGVGTFANIPWVRTLLGFLSLSLLLILAFLFLRGAFLSAKKLQQNTLQPTPPKRKLLASTKGGFALGLTLALTSPWNLAFWLAVLGKEASYITFSQSLWMAGSVVLGAATWGLLFCTAIKFGAKFSKPSWEVITQALTGLLMLFFAGFLVLRLLE